MSEYFKIGKFVAVFGLHGELVLQHSLGKRSTLKDIKALFVEDKKDSFLPYFIESSKVRSERETLVTLEGLNTRELAQKLAQKEVWLMQEDFQRLARKSAPISLLGFSIFEGNELLGEVLEVIEQPHQVLCRIDWQGNEALIPVHEGTLVRIDQKKRQVIVELPEGLLDIYRK